MFRPSSRATQIIMSFADTMTLEIQQSRRDRSRRALFYAKLMGICLVLLVGGILRTEPDLRSALMIKGMDAMMQLMGRTAPQDDDTQSNGPRTIASQGTAVEDTSASSLPRSTVKVNRTVGSKSQTNAASTEDIANDLGQTLSTRKVGN